MPENVSHKSSFKFSSVDFVGRVWLPLYHLKHFYLANPSHQFNFSPCNFCTVS